MWVTPAGVHKYYWRVHNNLFFRSSGKLTKKIWGLCCAGQWLSHSVGGEIHCLKARSSARCRRSGSTCMCSSGWANPGAAVKVTVKPQGSTVLDSHRPALCVPCVDMSDLERGFGFALPRENHWDAEVQWKGFPPPDFARGQGISSVSYVLPWAESHFGRR